MKPIFVINSLSETVAKKGSKLLGLAEHADRVFDDHIFDNLDLIVAAGRQAGWVIIEGGDGTAQGVITAFINGIGDINDMPKFTLLPGGMTNQVAKNIGLKKFSKSAILHLINGSSTETQTSLLKVSSQDHPNLYGFLFSTGGVPMITEYTKNKLHSRGIGGSAAVVGGIVKGLLGRDEAVLRPTNVKVSVDKNAIEGSHLGTLVTTLPSLLLGLDPFWARGAAPLRMTYVDANAKHLMGHVIGLWLGHKTKDRQADGLQSYRASQLTYHYDGPVVLDGEFLSLGPEFTVTATHPLTFIS